MRLLRSVCCCLLVVAASLGWAFAEEGQTPLTLAVYQWRPKAELLAKWQPLATYLSQALNGREIRVTVLSETELAAALDAGQVDFLLTNPRNYIAHRTERALTGALASLIELEGKAPITDLGGTIVVNAQDQHTQTLNDLKGKRIAFPGTQYMGAYLAPAHALAKVGIVLPTDAQMIQFDGRQDLGLQALASGKADAAFVRSGYLEELAAAKKIDPRQFRVLAERQHPGFTLKTSTDLYPNWPFVALKHVPPEVAARVAGALFQIKPGDTVAQASQIYGFSVPGDYLPVEDALRQLRLPPFGQGPKITKEDIWQEFQSPIVAASILVTVIMLLAVFLGLRSRQLAKARDEIQHHKAHLETEILQRTADLREALNRFDGFMNIVPSAIAIIDFDGKAQYFNAGFEKLLGYTQAEIPDMELWWEKAYPDPDYRQQIRQTWESALSTSANDGFPIKDFEARVCTLAGTYVWISAYAHVAEKTIYIAMVDITTRKQQQEKIISLNESLERRAVEAEAANSAKSAFLANMSHEIRTPMNGILGMVHVLRRTPLSFEQQKKLNVIESSGKHLLAIISDILDLSKIDAGKSQLHTKDFRLAEVLQSALSIVRIGAADKHLSLQLIDDGLPGAVHGDPIRLTQALVNYLGNALKFTDKGSITLAAFVTEESRLGYRIRFEVRDTGIGIPEAQRQKLFQVFEQADNSSTRAYGGTGLGLAITQRIAQMMGGTVGLESSEGQGSTFWFTAQFGKTQPAHESAATARADDDEIELLLRQQHLGKRILVAEDEPMNQELTRGLLEDAGLLVETANDGAQALQLVQQRHFDLILMDMQMPVLSGIDATLSIRQLPQPQQCPIIALTANAFAEDREKCLAAGMNDFLTKPTDPVLLLKTVYRWLTNPS